MGYEYGANSEKFEIPNPHRVENLFLYACAGLCSIAAIGVLIASRHDYGVRDYRHFGRALTVGVALLAAAGGYALPAMRQMRFFFGRGQPADLVPHVEAGSDGYSDGRPAQIDDARALRETIRANAITYEIPRAPLDMVLYSLVGNLIYSPRVTQRLVRTHFRNVVALAFLLACFLVSVIGVGNAASVAWIALFYFVIANAIVLRPLALGRSTSVAFESVGIAIFVAASIIAPVILASAVPRHAFPFGNAIAFMPITLVILLTALGVSALLLCSGISNTVRPNTIAAAPHLETPSMNATPAQLFTELAREMQRLWVEHVPNRTYMRIPPDVASDRGAFDAHLIEETQPLAQDIERLTFAKAFSLETTRWLLVADIVGTILTSFGVAQLLVWATSKNATDAILYGSSLLVVGRFALRGANDLWRRFEYKSRLYWVECNGNFSRASTNSGALLTDRVRTSHDLINVEAMTLRVWVVEVDSVAFDTARTRDIVSLRGLPGEAERVGKHLAAFGSNQPSIIVPTSTIDRERLTQMDGIATREPGSDARARALAGDATQLFTAVGSQSAGSTFCVGCERETNESDAFCSGCGRKR